MKMIPMNQMGLPLGTGYCRWRLRKGSEWLLVCVVASTVFSVSGKEGEGNPSNSSPSPSDSGYWAFQAVAEPAVPRVNDAGWARNPIDHFVYARLKDAELEPAPQADRLTLIRRAFFDLLGLPPTPEQIERFLEDDAPDAYERLIDRLLESPRYGERWARHWLDLVRYAESDGFRGDFYRPQAWRYRDYVIEAFNEDKPYDQFVREQLAGDEIAPKDPDTLVATAYLRHGVYEWNQRDARTQWNDILNEITTSTGEIFLGLSMGCARCHDHKFDPIRQRDYFRLRAFFEPLLWRDDRPLATPAEKESYRQERTEWERANADLLEKLEAIEAPAREEAAEAAIVKFPDDVEAMARKPASERSPKEIQLAYLVYRQVEYEQTKRLERYIPEEQKEKWKELKEKLKKRAEERPDPLPPQFTVSDVGAEAPPTTIPKRPDASPVQPGPPAVLGSSSMEPFPRPDRPGATTGRRLALARWLTQPDNPLSTRVIVNRIWQYHFGRGIVGTASDFGHLGERPSHPDLLDWLTRAFIRNGWRWKPIHRMIMTSATYRQASQHPSAKLARETDPNNRRLWRFPIQRLDADQLRDAMLVAAGELDRRMGGPSVETEQPRRSVYIKVIRNQPDPLLKTFDRPDGFNCVAIRDVTTTEHQALLMLNGEWPLERAAALVDELGEPPNPPLSEWIERAYLRVLNRPPSAQELKAAKDFIGSQQGRLESEKRENPSPRADRQEALRDFVHVLFNTSEFVYID